MRFGIYTNVAEVVAEPPPPTVTIKFTAAFLGRP